MLPTTFYTSFVLVKIIQIFGMKRREEMVFCLFQKKNCKDDCKMIVGRNNKIFEIL